MNEVETALATMFVERAQGVQPEQGHRERTLRRAKRRRVRNAAAVGLASVVFAAGGFGAVRALDTSPEAVAPAGPGRSGTTTSTAGPLGFRSTTATEYPYVANGYFRAADWRLRAAAIRLGTSDVRLTFDIGGAGSGSMSSSVELSPADLFAVNYGFGDWTEHGNVAVVFGAAPPETETVDVTLETGDVVRAHVFRGYDNKTTLELVYFVVFVPADVTGDIAAHGGGRELGTEVIP